VVVKAMSKAEVSRSSGRTTKLHCYLKQVTSYPPKQRDKKVAVGGGYLIQNGDSHGYVPPFPFSL
jgi:hypothetical protein